jgi:histone acetyltransferase 1
LSRCIEILLLKRLKKWDAEAVREYRLFVKKRIYKKNKEVLEDMDLGDRINKLQQTFELVEEDYLEIITKL